MALIKCPECNKEISNTAKKCPNCGYSLSTKSIKNILVPFSIILIVLLIIGCFILYNHSQPIYQYKKQAISILTEYKNNTISNKEAREQLDNLCSKMYGEKDPNNILLGLEIEINSISYSLFDELSNTQIDNYINEIKNK